MRRQLVALSLALIAASAFVPAPSAAQEQPSAGQKHADLTKPSVVRILDGFTGSYIFQSTAGPREYPVSLVGSGSGSFIDSNGYVLTNAHVVDSTHKGAEKAEDDLFVQFVIKLAQDYGEDPREVLRNGSLLAQIKQSSRLVNLQHYHHVITPDGSNFPFEIKAFGAPVGEGKDVAIIKVELKNAPVLKIGDSDKVKLQDPIWVYGYPAAADTSLLSDKSFQESSITDGKVSAKKSAADGSPILQVSAAATHGNSGGPVLNANGEIVGILTFRGDTVNGQEVQGFTFVVAASTIQEFVRQAGASNVQGIVDQKYREALDLFYQAHFTSAIEKLNEVKQLFPQHSEAERLIREAQQAKAEGKEVSSFPMGIVIGVVVVGGLFVVLLLGGGLIFILSRGKKKQVAPPMQAPAFQPHAPQPHMGMQPQIGGHVPMPGAQRPMSSPVPPPVPPMPAVAPPPPGGAERTVAISAVAGGAPAGFTSPVQQGLGTLVCTQGALAGQRFEIKQEGLYIGRDGTLSQVVIPDGRISKRHVWIGPRSGRIAVVDQQSTNGTFLNVPGSQRVTESILNPGDTVILSEADVARFQFQR